MKVHDVVLGISLYNYTLVLVLGLGAIIIPSLVSPVLCLCLSPCSSDLEQRRTALEWVPSGFDYGLEYFLPDPPWIHSPVCAYGVWYVMS